MRLGKDSLSDPRAASGAEWILGNALGGSASGTVAGALTRATHGHLVAATPDGGLVTVLLKLEERLLGPEGTFELGSNAQAGGGLRPAGWTLIDEFRADPWPVWRYRAGSVVIEKSLLLVTGHNAVVVSYRHRQGPEARITVSPLLTARHPARLDAEPSESTGAAQGVPGRVRIDLGPGRPSATLWHNGVFMPTRARQWLYHPLVDAASDQERQEEAVVPGYIEATLSAGSSLHVVTSIEEDLFRRLAREDRLGSPPPQKLEGCVALIEAEEAARVTQWGRAALKAAFQTARQAGEARAAHRGDVDASSTSGAETPLGEAAGEGLGGEPWVERLAETLRRCVVKRGSRLALVSSLPSATERGEDAMRIVFGLVSLRGFEVARQVLADYVAAMNEGLAPERFEADGVTPIYGGPASALWLVAAGEQYVRRSGDLDFGRDVLSQALEAIAHAYRAGAHGIRVEADGLLAVDGPKGMTRRADLNVLWFHALVAIAQLARSVGRKESGAFHLAWAHELQRRFNEAFWDEKNGCLYEALGPKGPVRGLTPSQLLAASLPPMILTPERAARLVRTVEKKLVMPLGLRLAADSSQIAPEWLGPYASAVLRAGGRSASAQEAVRARFATFDQALSELGLSQVPALLEVEKPAKPGRGRGRKSKLGSALAEALAPSGTVLAGAEATPNPPRIGGDLASAVAAAEILKVWVEELDHAAAPVHAGVS